jgi:cytochrome P450
MIKASNEAPSDSKLDIPQEANLSREEIVGNCFIFLFAGHETTANSIHYTFLHLAMHLAAQRRMQADIDSIVGRDKPISEFSYHTDMPRLYNSMVGAVMNEQMRLIPAILNILKETNGDQEVWIDGKRCLIPDGTLIHLNVVGTNRNPRYWPQSPDEFIPERWLPSQTEKGHAEEHIEAGVVDGLEQTSFETSNSTSLRKPMKGSFISFSEGARACPGRRFAQVEATAVLSAIFQKYSVELDVTEWANDEQLERMGIEEKRAVYGKAIERARNVIRRSEQTITLQMKRGDQLPVRFVARGKEKFGDVL